MDAHKVLERLFYQFGIEDVSKYNNYIYAGLAITTLLVYIIPVFFKKDDFSLINLVSLKRKVKDLEALTSQLSVSLENLEERLEIFSKQANFRLDMQSEEQKEIRTIISNLTTSVEEFVENFYESE